MSKKKRKNKFKNQIEKRFQIIFWETVTTFDCSKLTKVISFYLNFVSRIARIRTKNKTNQFTIASNQISLNCSLSFMYKRQHSLSIQSFQQDFLSLQNLFRIKNKKKRQKQIIPNGKFKLF